MEGMIDYSKVINKIYEQIIQYEKPKILKIANILGQSIIDGGIAHIFGTGHSEMVCKEVFTRAGSLSCFRIIGTHYELEKFERLEGMAEIIMADYRIDPGEIVFVVSSSGINALPIEVAQISKKMGGYLIAMSSLEHSRLVESRHSSGKKLYELADLVLDTHVPAGDAAIQFEELQMKVGPVSSLANIFIINSIIIETTAYILRQGKTPPIRVSRNLPQGDAHNQKFKEKYSDRIPELIL